jgi:hypothetical protein
MDQFVKIASDVIKITGDDTQAQYLRSVHAYAFAISLLFPPPGGGVPNLTTSAIVSSARTIAAARLFDYRTLNLDSLWRKREIKIGEVTFPHKSLSSKDLFQDQIAMFIVPQVSISPAEWDNALVRSPTFRVC